MIAKPKPPRRSLPEHHFLPAALEIQERPPHPAARVVTWTIAAFFTLAVLWSAIGEIDVVAQAQGKIVPSGRVKLIQPAETGVIRAIHVREGQAVEEGQLLIELDPTMSRAEVERLDNEHLAIELRLARLKALSLAMDSGAVDADAQFALPAGASPDQVALQRAILIQQWEEFQSRLRGLASEIERHRAEHETTRHLVAKLAATAPLAAKRATALLKLTQDQLAPQHQWLELEQERLEQEHDLAVQRSRLTEIDAAVAASERQREVLEAEFRRELLEQLAEQETQREALGKELIKARQRAALQRLTAPVAGVVQQLAVHTVGGVVTPAQSLMVVVPNADRLEIEAWVQNKDVGFVYEGQAAAIKVETFPFTKYGTIGGQLLSVSDDAVSDDQRGLVYAARVLMERATIQVGNRLVHLSPGMAVTVEIKTGKRRLIEYFLSPLLQHAQESLSER